MRGLVLYGSSFKIGIGDEGLCLAVFPLFRLGQEHLLIPSSDITINKQNNRINPVTIQLKKTQGAPLWVYGEPVADLDAY